MMKRILISILLATTALPACTVAGAVVGGGTQSMRSPHRDGDVMAGVAIGALIGLALDAATIYMISHETDHGQDPGSALAR